MSALVEEAVRFDWLDRTGLEDMIRESDVPTDWIVDRVVARGALTILAGEQGLAKSLFAKALAHAVSVGIDPDTAHANRFAISKGRALYFDCENGRRISGTRLGKIGAIRDSTGDDHVLYVEAGGKLDLGDDRHLVAVEDAVERSRSTFVVIDTLSMASGGADENANGIMGQIVGGVGRLAHETNVGILMLHHTVKGGATYRGASSIMGQTDLGFQMEALESGTRSGRLWQIVAVKNRMEEELPLRVGRILLSGGRTFLRSETPTKGQEAEHEAWLRFLALEAAIRADGRWRKAKVADAIGIGASTRPFERLWERAIEAGWEAKEGRGGGIAPPPDETSTAALEKDRCG
jgi:hypothetical protein